MGGKQRRRPPMDLEEKLMFNALARSKRRVKVTPDQLSLVLAAIAEVEGWNAPSIHPSILSNAQGWITVSGQPMPSGELISTIERLSGMGTVMGSQGTVQ